MPCRSRLQDIETFIDRKASHLKIRKETEAGSNLERSSAVDVWLGPIAIVLNGDEALKLGPRFPHPVATFVCHWPAAKPKLGTITSSTSWESLLEILWLQSDRRKKRSCVIRSKLQGPLERKSENGSGENTSVRVDHSTAFLYFFGGQVTCNMQPLIIVVIQCVGVTST